MSEVTLRQNSYVRSHDGPGERDSARPRFYMGSRQDQAASASAGRPIYQEVEMVEVFLPANLYSRPHLTVTDVERERWATEYAKFKKGLEQADDGTPLEEWSVLNRSQVLELKAMGFKSVEDLANMSDAVLQRIGRGALVIRNKAQAYIEQAEGNAPLTKIVEENEAMKTTVDLQATQIAELNNLLSGLQMRLNELSSQRPVLDPAVTTSGPLPPAPPPSSLDALVDGPATRTVKKKKAA